MPRRPREEAIDAGERLLGEWGVAADAPPDQLAPLIGRAREADVAISHRLGNLTAEESAVLLVRIDQESADKLVRKEAKRALYKLHQRGIPIPSPAPAEPVRIAPAPLDGYLSQVDGRGDQLVWLVRPVTGGIAHLFAVINDPEGLREVDLNVVSRKVLRSLRDDLARKHDIHLVEADGRYCDFLIHRAFEWTTRRGGTTAGDYPALRRQLASDPAPTDLPPPIRALVADGDVAAGSELLERSSELLGEKEFRTWFFDEETLKSYLEELANIRESPIVLEPVQQEERMRAVMERVAADLFGGEMRESWVRRLYANAYVFWKTRRPEQARQTVAVAQALAESPHGGKGIPFCEDLARMSLLFHVQASREAEEERARSSLVLTPAQLRAEQTRSRGKAGSI